MSALCIALGRQGEPPTCKETDSISFHWWPSSALAGDPCLCGTQKRSGHQPGDVWIEPTVYRLTEEGGSDAG